MKKLYFLLGIISSTVVCLCACDSTPYSNENNSPTKLDTPVVTYCKGVISWNEVENADKYELSLDGDIIVTYKTEYSLNVGYEAESYEVKVKAISETTEYLNSAFSDLLSFSSYVLPDISLKSINYSEERDTVRLNLNYEGNKVQLYINDNPDKSYASKTIELSNTQFNVGENIVTLIACSNKNTICDSKPLRITVYKNNDFKNVRYEDGKLLCSINQSEIEYDTSTFPAGESEQIIRNKTTSTAQITLSSDGIVKSIKKLESPKIESCMIKEIGGWSYIIDVTLIDIGNVYDKVELIINRKSFPTSFICDDKNIVYENNKLKFVFDISRTSAMGFETFHIRLYKDGFISSSLIECRNT